MSRRLLVAVSIAAVSLVAACTSSGGGTASSTSPALTTSPPVSSAPVSAPSSPVGLSAPLPTPTSSVATLPNPLPDPSAVSRVKPSPTATSIAGGCTAAQLKATSARGGAFQGREFAAVIFTNISKSACNLRGYPAAQLLHGDQPLGKPATASSNGTVATIRITPGHSAQAALSAVSTCQSPLSDHVQVSAPGTVASFVVPVQLRGCALSVDPVEAA